MQNFTTKIVNMMKSENLYASQGGPIILSQVGNLVFIFYIFEHINNSESSKFVQIENEYQNIEKAFHDKGPPYVRWAAAMAVGLETGVPWAMCKQDDAPDPVVKPTSDFLQFHILWA